MMTINPEVVTAADLDELSDRLELQELLPRLVRRLLTRTEGVKGVTMRANERLGPGPRRRVRSRAARSASP